MDELDDNATTVSETENYWVDRTSEDSEVMYHVQLGNVTLHLFEDEWKELVELIQKAVAA